VDRILRFLRSIPLPIWIVGGGAGAVVAYTSTQRRAQATAAAVAAAATPAAFGAPPGQEAALIAQGAGLGLQGAALGLQTAERSLGLAEAATLGALSLGGVLAGSQAQVAGTLGEAVGTLAGTVAAIATPQPGVFAPAAAPIVASAPAPAPAAAPAPAPAPTSSERRTFIGYEVAIAGAGTIPLYGGSCGSWSRSRLATFAGPSRAPVAPVSCGGGQVGWRTTAGGYTGLAYLTTEGAGAGLWSIRKVWRVETLSGSTVTASRTEYEPISKSGS
jgi:hypothetical protein